MENSDNKLFVNKSVYTSEVYAEFLRFHNRRYNFSYWAYTVIWAIVLFFCIIVAFGSQMRIQGVLITAILVCFVGYRVIRPKFIVERELKSDKVSEKSANTFSFYDSRIGIANANGKFSYKYIMLRRVFETDSFFYLYVSKENAFLIDKKGFSLGTAEEFSRFIRNKCKFKYKKISNPKQ